MTIKACVSCRFVPVGAGKFEIEGTYLSQDSFWQGSGYVQTGEYDSSSLVESMMTDIATAVKNDLVAHGVTMGGSDTVRILNPYTG